MARVETNAQPSDRRAGVAEQLQRLLVVVEFDADLGEELVGLSFHQRKPVFTQ